MIEIEHCPFCGGKTLTRITDHGGCGDVDFGVDFIVSCRKCGSTKTVHMNVGLKNKRTFKDYIAHIDKAIESWNRRAEE